MLTYLLVSLLAFADEPQMAEVAKVPRISGLTSTAPAADIAWTVAVNLWDDEKPSSQNPGPVPPPPEEEYVFVFESEFLPIGPIAMTQDRLITTLGKPPKAVLKQCIVRSSWRHPHNVRQRINEIHERSLVEPVVDPLPPPAPVSEPID